LSRSELLAQTFSKLDIPTHELAFLSGFYGPRKKVNKADASGTYLHQSNGQLVCQSVSHSVSQSVS